MREGNNEIGLVAKFRVVMNALVIILLDDSTFCFLDFLLCNVCVCVGEKGRKKEEIDCLQEKRDNDRGR